MKSKTWKDVVIDGYPEEEGYYVCSFDGDEAPEVMFWDESEAPDQWIGLTNRGHVRWSVDKWMEMPE
jgi:hypothetical protein